MSQRILIGVAWPYANGSLHMGHIAGCYLSADIFARFHRMNGNQVLMVSGSDQHGTPITIRAEQENVSPKDIVSKYHKEFLSSWKSMGISFDIFTTTGTENHRQTVHDIFTTLLEKNYIYTNTVPLPYCHTCKRSIPDRYLKGTCPNCGNLDARGDQCDNCGKPMNPEDLLDIKCRISGDTPEIRNSEHFFLKLSAFQKPLLEWVNKQKHWRPNVLNFTRRYIEDGLIDRAITRDLDWGIDVPVTGFEDKKIYVWFEAVIGYLSASKEWASATNDPEAWKDFWHKDAKIYNFLGKDNIPFHTIIWPAMLMGVGGFNLPYDVPANEFLNLEGYQLSTSRNWAVWIPEYLEKYDKEQLRYYLSANMPESGDSDFSWKDFVRRNNDELVATYGNLVHRVLTFTYRNFDQSIPTPLTLTTSDTQFLEKVNSLFSEVTKQLEECHFRNALLNAMAIAQEANRFLETSAPWKTIKTDRETAGTTMWVALSAINCLKMALYPFLPSTSQKLHEMLGFSDLIEKHTWAWHSSEINLPPKQRLNNPEALFVKFEDEIAEEESSKLGIKPQ